MLRNNHPPFPPRPPQTSTLTTLLIVVKVPDALPLGSVNQGGNSDKVEVKPNIAHTELPDVPGGPEIESTCPEPGNAAVPGCTKQPNIVARKPHKETTAPAT